MYIYMYKIKIRLLMNFIRIVLEARTCRLVQLVTYQDRQYPNPIIELQMHSRFPLIVALSIEHT